MVKVKGFAEIGVWVDCPKCNHYFDVIHFEDKYFGESETRDRLFTNTTESCTNINKEVECPKCDHEFILDSIEY